MSLFRRLFKIGQAEAHSAIDSLENPIKLAEQGIRDLKVDLDKSLKAMAEVKAMAIRSKSEVQEYKSEVALYEKKAIQLVDAGQTGKLAQADADRLAESALTKMEESKQHFERATKSAGQFDNSIAQLQGNIDKIKANISKWENELKTLKARAKVSAATKSVNKQLSQIDSSGTVSMLERMKEKVEKDEALSEAYGEIANESKSVDDEIDSVLNTGTSSSDALAALKAKMAS